MGQYTQDELMFNDKLASRHRYNTRGFNAAPLTLKPGSSASGTGLRNYDGTTAGKLSNLIFHNNNAQITTEYGHKRTDGPHNAIDIALSGSDNPVYSVGEGQVLKIGKDKLSGNYITVDHGNNIVSEYLHLANDTIPKEFKVGTPVDENTILGIQGNTGRSRGPTGIHVHFIIKHNGVRINPMSQETKNLFKNLFGNTNYTNSVTNRENPNKKEGMAPINNKYESTIQKAALDKNIDVDILRALIFTESRYNPNAVSSAGAKGIAQIKDGTAKSLGISNQFDPVQSINGAAQYIRTQLDRDVVNNNYQLALVAYNSGPSSDAFKLGKQTTYVIKVLTYAGKDLNWKKP